MTDACDVLILGAGAAGLTAARDLAPDFHVVILEARDRVGGRLHTRHHDDHPLPVELGPEFVHGHMPDTFAQFGPAGLVAYEIADRHEGARNGRPVPQDATWAKAEALLGRLGSIRARDLSFADFLKRHASRSPANVRRMAAMFVEGFNAAADDDISCRSLAKAAEEESKYEDGDKQYRLIGGYDHLAQVLARQIQPPSKVELNTIVRAVRWANGRVEVDASTPDGSGTFSARAAIIALPLGVLQALPDARAGVRFAPELPTRSAIANGLAMGSVTKLTFRFREPFWEATPFKDLAFVHRPDAAFPTWWSMLPLRTNVLTAWAGGPASRALDALDDAGRIDRAVDSLAALLGVPRRKVVQQLVRVDAHDWQTDPFSRGAYSYARVGGADVPERLAVPIAGTLFFAGEHTHGGLLGTVAGAIHSGTEASKRVTRVLRSSIARSRKTATR